MCVCVCVGVERETGSLVLQRWTAEEKRCCNDALPSVVGERHKEQITTGGSPLIFLTHNHLEHGYNCTVTLYWKSSFICKLQTKPGGEGEAWMNRRKATTTTITTTDVGVPAADEGYLTVVSKVVPIRRHITCIIYHIWVMMLFFLLSRPDLDLETIVTDPRFQQPSQPVLQSRGHIHIVMFWDLTCYHVWVLFGKGLPYKHIQK